MTLTQKSLVALFITCFLFFATLFFVSSYTNIAKASAPPGLPATIFTVVNPTASTTAGIVMASSTCAARIVSTGVSAVNISFNDTLPTGTLGVLQAASTTVAYDSGQYGCGTVRIFSYVSQLVTVIDSR